MVSITAAVIAMIMVALLYALTAYLSHLYNHGGRDPINPLYSISQWDPRRVDVRSSCTVPLFPGNCVIEGMTGAYQPATHWCAIEGPCIDPDTGENVKGNPIPFQAVCSEVPYCGWSQCAISFGEATYVNVQVAPDKTFVFTTTSILVESTIFYMERIAVGDKGLVLDQNGTIAIFRFQLPGDSNTYILSYTNNFVPHNAVVPVTALTAQLSSNSGVAFLTMFVLMENMPTTVSSAPGIGSAIVARKILAFGGVGRQNDISADELRDFNDHVRGKLWAAANKYNLVIIRWNTDYVGQDGFYGTQADLYAVVLNNWKTNSVYSMQQDVVERRLHREPGPVHRPFYNWIG